MISLQKNFLTSRYFNVSQRVEACVPGSMAAQPLFYILPDTLRNWPYKRIISPRYHAAEDECLAWLKTLMPVSPAGLKAIDKAGNGE
jgi:hypothetical protein